MTHRTAVRIRLLLLSGALAFLSCACQESRFRLAADSRLPRWVQLPPGLSRADVTLTLGYYTAPWGDSAYFQLLDANGTKLDSASASIGREPIILNGAQYPSYQIVTVRGSTEVIEHRRQEPIFYICDDPVAKAKLGIKN